MEWFKHYCLRISNPLLSCDKERVTRTMGIDCHITFSRMGVFVEKISLVQIIAAVILFLNITSEGDEQKTRLYLSPWNSIKGPSPEVVDFDENGNIKRIPVPPNNIIRTYSFIPDSKKNEVDRYVLEFDPRDYYEGINITKYILDNMQKRIEKIYRGGIRKKKVFTRCNDNLTFCRFLMCPMVKQYCTLCEVKLKESSKKLTTTTCEHVSTRFLFHQTGKRFYGLMKK